MQAPVLLTKRLRLRPVVEADADALFAICAEPNLGPNAGWKPHETAEETKQLIREVFSSPNVWAIERLDTQSLIGTVGLMEDEKRENPRIMTIGYSLSETAWGNGFMTEAVRGVLRYAFEELKLRAVSATCYPFNERSRRVLLKCGFEAEGVLQEAEILYNGEVYDHECYLLKIEEYLG